MASSGRRAGSAAYSRAQNELDQYARQAGSADYLYRGTQWAGNENPQLDVITTSGSGQCCNLIYASGTNDFPLRPDWQPRP